jgi:hypothetical protein
LVNAWEVKPWCKVPEAASILGKLWVLKPQELQAWLEASMGAISESFLKEVQSLELAKPLEESPGVGKT